MACHEQAAARRMHRYVTDERRSSRPIFNAATQRMAADELARKGVLNRFPRNKMLQQYALSPEFLPDAQPSNPGVLRRE